MYDLMQLAMKPEWYSLTHTAPISTFSIVDLISFWLSLDGSLRRIGGRGYFKLKT